MADRLKGLLGLSRRAGKLLSGEFASERSIKAGKAKLCILASDASENTKKKFGDICRSGHVPCLEAGLTKSELGHAAGCGDRTSAVIEDEGFAESMIKLI